MRALRLLSTTCLICLAGAAVRAAEAPRVAVMNIVVEQGIAPGTVRLLNELLLTELSETGRFLGVIGERDIVSLIQLEEERAKLTGCVDEACLAEIGGALGVDYMLSSNVGQMGDRYVLNAKLLDVRGASVAARVSEIVAMDEGALIKAMRRAVDRLCEQTFPSEGDLTGTLAWTATAVGVACLVTGAVVGGLALKDQGELDGKEKLDPDLPALRDKIRAEAVAADVLLGLGAVAAVTSIVLFIVGGGDDEEATPQAVVAPSLGGGQVGLQVILGF